MKQATSQIIYNYWNAVRNGRLAPTRFEIEPSQMASILCETFILERANPRNYPFRLAGTRICESFGRELRGQSFSALAGEDERVVLKALEAVTDEGAVATFEIEAETADGRSVVMEAIVLPLLHPSHAVTRYLGTLSVVEPPAWLGSEPLHPTGLVGHDIIWPAGRPHSLMGEHDRQHPFAPELAAARIFRSDRRLFRILDGGRKE